MAEKEKRQLTADDLRRLNDDVAKLAADFNKLAGGMARSLALGSIYMAQFIANWRAFVDRVNAEYDFELVIHGQENKDDQRPDAG